MKKLLAAVLALSFLGCQDDLNNSTTETPQQSVAPDVISKLETLGYNTTDIPVYEANTSYIVEGDMVFTDEDLNNALAGKQRRTRQLIACENRLNIRIKNDLSGVHSRALETAVSNWNSNANSLVSFTIANRNTTMTVRFARANDNLASTTAAAASGPRNGLAGSLIRVNRERLGNAPWERVLTHELGHTIGFAHTNTSEGTFIRGSLRNDASSIMNSGGNAGCCISRGDRDALDLLYGDCEATPSNR